MPKISEISTIINTSLKENVFNTSRFQSAVYYGIADLVKENINDTVTTKPCIIANDGECTSVIIDDTYPMQIYHRIMSLSFEQSTEDNYGEPVRMIKETATMSLVLIADRNRLQMDAENIVSAIAANLPPTLTAAELATLGLSSCQIYATGEAVIDSEVIFNREYRNIEYLFKPNAAMFSINYLIEMEFSKSCFDICE